MPARIPDQLSSTEPAPAPKNLPQPPPIAAPGPDTRPAATAQMSIPKTPNLPPPRAARTKRAAKKAAPVAAAVNASTPPTASVEQAEEKPPPVYRLGELRSPEEKAKLRNQAEWMIGVCNSALTAAEGKTLTASQAELATRVRTFAQQAKETLDKDPGEARGFAAKGRTFAEALLAELK
jgi:hypothetical protein